MADVTVIGHPFYSEPRSTRTRLTRIFVEFEQISVEWLMVGALRIKKHRQTRIFNSNPRFEVIESGRLIEFEAFSCALREPEVPRLKIIL